MYQHWNNLSSIMSQKRGLIQLIHLHETLDHLSHSDFLKWLRHLVSTNQKPLIISAIFRELYRQAKQINIDTLDDIVQTASLLLSQSTTDNGENGIIESMKLTPNSDHNIGINLINNIPDTVLSRIATYLQTKELFFNWNTACKTLFRIGMKPESIHHWYLTQAYTVHSSQFQTQFDTYSLLSQLKMITFHGISKDRVLKSFPKTTSANWELIDVDASALKRDVWDSIFHVRKLILRDTDCMSSDCEHIEQCRTSLKQLVFVGGGIRCQNNECLYGVEDQRKTIIENEWKILKVLQTIIPLSEKDHEIECRILQEKIKIFNANPNLVDRDRIELGDPTFVTPYLTDKQIEQIIHDVKQEIELKYDDINTVDAEELSYYDENNKKIEQTSFICNPIEMMEFDNCESGIAHEYSFVLGSYLKNGHSRTVHGLSNLKSLGFCGYDRSSVNGFCDSCDCDNEEGLLSMATQLILNSIGNKLLSLHICSSTVIWNKRLHFYKKIQKKLKRLAYNDILNEKWLKNCENESWYLKNISELCLKIKHDVWNELLHGLSPLINGYTFPSLKNLKIICFLNSTNLRPQHKSPMMRNYNYNQNGINPDIPFLLISLMSNHLESLDLCFDKWSLEDFFVMKKTENKEESNNQESNEIGLYLNDLRLQLMKAKTAAGKQANITSNYKKFILKLHFKITIPYNIYSFSQYAAHNYIKLMDTENTKNLASICDEVIKLCKWICDAFENSMFGFKITFHANQNAWKRWDSIVKKFESLCNIICDNPFLKSIYTNANSNTNLLSAQGLTFQASMKQYMIPNYDHEVVFVMILNKHGNGTGGSINGYCEPRFEYPCQYCATQKWLESSLSDEFGCASMIHRVIE